MWRRVFLIGVAQVLIAAAQPQFSFGVLTDIQYGDQETAGKRNYRASMGKLTEAVGILNREPLDFVIQLGDLIDSKSGDLDPILHVFNQLAAPRYSVLGNHDFAARRATLQQRLGRPAYYSFTAKNWRFLVTDGMDVSVKQPAGRQILESLQKAKAPNAHEWNGAIGDEQLKWLQAELDDAAAKHERVIVFCHFPVLASVSTPAHLLWNHDELVHILETHPAVAGWFNGHDHAGGYAKQNGIHFVTFPGMVESGSQNSFTVVRVYPDRLELEGTGTAPRRVLPLSPR